MSRYKKSGKKHPSTSLADITLNDFANSSVSSARSRKSITNVSKFLKQLKETEKSWDENIESFDGDFVEHIDDDGNVTYVIEKTEPRRRRKTTSSSEDRKTDGNQYPIDIWFLISDHIRPEDVGRFAGICKTSYNVVSSAKFWFSLYKRHYVTVQNMPERLQPECLFRRYGIRTLVVRALNYMYPPFVARLKDQTDPHPDSLKRTCCVLMWHRSTKNQYFYFFKMKSIERHRGDYGEHNVPDLLEMLDDVYANHEENCRILQVTCKRFIPLVPVLGLRLISANLNLSSELRTYKLLMKFGSECQKPTDGGTVIALEPVINVKVLDWWHPLYPHVHEIEHLFNRE